MNLGKSLGKVEAFKSLNYRNFRWLLTAALISSLARWGEGVLFGWLTYELTGSAFKTGAVVALRSAGYLLSPIAGVVADRYDRRRVMMGVLASSAFYTLILALLITTDMLQFWHLMAISALGSLTNAFDNPIRKTLAADLVPPAFLSSAYAMTVVATDTTAIVGPAMAGILIGSIGAIGVVWVNIIVYLTNIWSFKMMKLPAVSKEAKKVSPLKNLFEGAYHTWNNKAVLGLMAISILANMLPMAGRGALLPVFAKSVFNMGPSGLGFLASAGGIGGLVGALAVVFFGNTRHKAKISIGTGIGMGVVLILFALSPTYAIALVLSGVLGASSAIFLTLSNALLLQLAPLNVRGRVMGVRGMVLLANLPGGLLAGALAEMMGARGAGVIIGIACSILMILTAVLVPAMARADKRELPKELDTNVEGAAAPAVAGHHR